MAKAEGHGLTMGSKGHSASLHAPEPGRYAATSPSLNSKKNMEINLTIALIAASSALVGSLIPTVFGYINSRSQRKFETQKSLRENQKEAYASLLLTLEETMSCPSLDKMAALQRAVILVAIYGDDRAAQSANSYFSALVKSQQSQPLTKEQHQQHHEAVLSGVRSSLGLNALPGFELVSVSRSAPKNAA